MSNKFLSTISSNEDIFLDIHKTRAKLGLVPGSTISSFSNKLNSIANLTLSNGKILKATNSNTFTTLDISTHGENALNSSVALLTNADLPTNNNTLTNGAGYITNADLPTDHITSSSTTPLSNKTISFSSNTLTNVLSTNTNQDIQAEKAIDQDNSGKLKFKKTYTLTPVDTYLEAQNHGSTSVSDRTIYLPSIKSGTVTDVLCGLNAEQILTNKTLTNPSIYNITNSGATMAFPNVTGTIALTSDIPTNNSSLTNGANYITSASIPTNNNTLTNGAGYITNADLPTDHITASSTNTLTNKTLTAPSISSPNFTNSFKFSNSIGFGSNSTLQDSGADIEIGGGGNPATIAIMGSDNTNSRNWKLANDIDDTGFGSGDDKLSLRVSTSNSNLATTDVMVWDKDGNVGIGTNIPSSLLHIYTDENRGTTNTTNKTMITIESNPSEDCSVQDFNPISIDFKMSNDTDDYTNIARISALIAPQGGHNYTAPHGTAQGEGSNALLFSTSYNTTLSEQMRITHEGYLGVKNKNPLVPLDIGIMTYADWGSTGTHVGYWNTTMNDGVRFGVQNEWFGGTNYGQSEIGDLDGGSGTSSSSSWTQGWLSMRAQGGIFLTEGEYNVSSDERIKEKITDVSDNKALEMVRKIPCRKYYYKDVIKRGIGQTIGFIAQEVKKVFPQAVMKTRSFIPSVYKKLVHISWIEEKNGFKFKDNSLQDVSGIKYRFFVSNTNEEEIKEELIGNENGYFFIDKKYERIFCYGKEINDFHALNKQKIFTLHHSAIQEIDKKQQELTERIAYLESVIGSLQ